VTEYYAVPPGSAAAMSTTSPRFGPFRCQVKLAPGGCGLGGVWEDHSEAEAVRGAFRTHHHNTDDRMDAQPTTATE
jgi:hypothetical protein